MTITIETKGRRHYITGDTYPIRDRLRSAGCKWDPEERAWWTGKRETAEALVSAPPSETTERPKDQAPEYVAGKATYKGRTYYVGGRIVRGRTHYDDSVEPLRTRDGSAIRLVFLDGSNAFWAASEAVQTTKTYQRPKTILGLREYAERAKKSGGGSLEEGYYYGPGGEVLASGCSDCRQRGTMCPSCEHDYE